MNTTFQVTEVSAISSSRHQTTDESLRSGSSLSPRPDPSSNRKRNHWHQGIVSDLAVDDFYEGCSHTIGNNFISFFKYILRQNVIRFWKELFVALKLVPNIKEHTIHFLSYIHLYEGHSYILIFSEANCNRRFGT